MKKILIIALVILIIAVASVAGYFGYSNHRKSTLYMQAQEDMNKGDYDKALTTLESILDYKDAQSLYAQSEKQIMLHEAEKLFETKKFDEARELYKKAGVKDKEDTCTFFLAGAYAENKEYEKAINELETIIDYAGASELLEETRYHYAIQLYEEDEIDKAKELFSALGSYKETPNYLEKCNLAVKYENFDYENFDLFDTEVDITSLSKVEVREMVEGLCEKLLYNRTWHGIEKFGAEEVIIDKNEIDNRKYQILAYKDRRMDGVEIDFCYQDDTETEHVLDITYSYEYSDIGVDSLTYLQLDDDRFCEASVQELAEYDKENMEMQGLLLMEEDSSGEEVPDTSVTAGNATMPKLTDNEIYTLCTPYIERSFSRSMKADVSTFEFIRWVSASQYEFAGIQIIQANYLVKRTDKNGDHQETLCVRLGTDIDGSWKYLTW